MIESCDVILSTGNLPESRHDCACENTTRAQTRSSRQVGPGDQFEATPELRQLIGQRSLQQAITEALPDVQQQ